MAVAPRRTKCESARKSKSCALCACLHWLRTALLDLTLIRHPALSRHPPVPFPLTCQPKTNTSSLLLLLKTLKKRNTKTEKRETERDIVNTALK
uniref:Putative secreted protein n=1 Tax=Anopheles triannulatus TaxID=58253 RepID=A0A2M4B2M6_9DIPT